MLFSTVATPFSISTNKAQAFQFCHIPANACNFLSFVLLQTFLKNINLFLKDNTLKIIPHLPACAGMCAWIFGAAIILLKWAYLVPPCSAHWTPGSVSRPPMWLCLAFPSLADGLRCRRIRAAHPSDLPPVTTHFIWSCRKWPQLCDKHPFRDVLQCARLSLMSSSARSGIAGPLAHWSPPSCGIQSPRATWALTPPLPQQEVPPLYRLQKSRGAGCKVMRHYSFSFTSLCLLGKLGIFLYKFICCLRLLFLWIVCSHPLDVWLECKKRTKN